MKPRRERTMPRLEVLEDRNLLSGSNVLPLSVSPFASLPTLPGGSFLTNQTQLQITGTTVPGDTVRLETGNDTKFGEGAAVADKTGHFTMTVHLAIGLNTLKLRVTDKTGEGDAQLLVTRDNQQPKVVVTQPAVGLATHDNPAIIGQVSDAGAPISLLQESVDGGAYTNVPMDSTGHFTFTPALALNGSADGAHTAHFRATDEAGNTSTTNLRFVLDTKAPKLVVVTPATGLVTGHDPTITGVVGDAGSGVSQLQVSVDSGAYSNLAFKALGIFNFTPNVALSTSGVHVVHFVATDKAGNQSTTDFSFTISSTYTWVNASGGDWDNPANWDRDKVPGAGDIVVINKPGNVVITHSKGNDSIASLVSSAPIQLTGGTLQVSGTVQVNNKFTLAGGTLSGADVLAGTGGQGITLTSAGGVLNGVTTAVNIDGTQSVGANATITNGLTLNNATIKLGNNAATNPTFGTLSFSDSVTSSGVVPQTLGGTGTVVFGVNPSNSLAGKLGVTLGSGIVVRGAMGTISGTVVNKGTINADTIGTITIDPSIGSGIFTNKGTMISGNGVLVFDAAAGAAIVNDGILTKGDGYPGGGGSVTINGDFTQGSTGVINFVVSSAQDPNGGGFQISGHAILAGSLDIVLIDGFVPVKGDGGKVLKYGSETGTFSTVKSTPALPSGMSFQVSYSTSGIVVLVT